MARTKTLLIVEDDMQQLGRYLDLARGGDFEPRGVRSVEEAKDLLKRIPVDVLLTDIHLSGTMAQDTHEGLALLAHVKENHPEILAIAMSSDPKIETYHRALDNGASHFLKKPLVTSDELVIGLDVARGKRIAERASRAFAKPQTEALLEKFKARCEDGVVLSQSIRDTVRAIAANRRVPVLLTGETGTGKEIVARLIHKRRSEAEGGIPFMAVNCAHLGTDVALSALFGHKKGAFTGAMETTNGVIGEADGGILFLDEIHCLSLPCQQKLLRVLNDGTYERLGDSKPLRSEFQIVCASTKDIDDLVEEGTFLMDLRTRITGVDIPLPPLRDRLEDLPYLISLFFAREQVEISPTELLRLSERCSQYYWRGNIRQLYMALQSLVALSSMSDHTVLAENLPVFKTMLPPDDKETASVALLGFKGLPADAAKNVLKPLGEDAPLEASVDLFEKYVILAALSRYGKISDAAASLELSRSTLDFKRKKHGLL